MTDDREAQIRDRAYAIWESEGQPEGRDREHWSQAEGELGDDAGSVAADPDEAPADASEDDQETAA